VLVHPGSIVHGLVTLADGSMLAHLGLPDMRVTIAYALHHPNRIDLGTPPPDLPTVGPLQFETVDHHAFPCLEIAVDAAKAGGTAPCVLNAANEIAVEAFLAGRLRFGDIPRLVLSTLEQLPVEPVSEFDALLEADADARRAAREWLTRAARL
jgi:1-deoxy-D-xylulose-5-phosphate reductoisomerase